jgi:hypothetical protein
MPQVDQRRIAVKTKLLIPVALILLSSLNVACTDAEAQKENKNVKENKLVDQKTAAIREEERRKEAERQALLSQISDVEIERRLLSENVAGRKSKILSAEQRLESLRSELTSYEGKVEAYMMDHKLAVAAIAAGLGGAAVALDPNNEFCKEAKELGALFAVLAAAYAIANHEEIIQVADQLMQADARVKNFKRQIQETQMSLDSERGPLQQEEKKLQSLTMRVAEMRSRL